MKGDFSKAGAWTRNVLQGGNGISKLENGEWGFRKSGVMYENGEKTAVVKMTYNDRVSRNIDFLSKSVSQWGPNFYKWRDRMFDKLNNSWMGRKGNSYTDGAVNTQNAGIEFTSKDAESSDSKFNKGRAIDGTENIDGILNVSNGEGDQGGFYTTVANFAKSAEIGAKATDGLILQKVDDDTLIWVGDKRHKMGNFQLIRTPKSELGKKYKTDPDNVTKNYEVDQ